MLSKLAYVLLFLILTILHICTNLKPNIEVNASIKTIDLQLIRKLNLYVGYEYHHKMLWQAVMSSMFLIYGFWRCQREVEQEKLRQSEALIIRDKDTPAGRAHKISAATEVKLDWLRSRNKLPNSWQLFRLRVFVWFAVPWLLTFLLNGFFNYTHLNLIMRHFCTNPPEVFLLYTRVQLLFLQRLLSGAVFPFLSQMNGAFESLFAKPANFISYENDLLVEED